MDVEPEPWTADGWLDFVLGMDAWSARVARVYAELAPPTPVISGSVPDAELLDALLGLEVLNSRLRTLLDRCAQAAPAPSPPSGHHPTTGVLR